MRFRSFVILYIVLVTTPIVLFILCSMGMALEIFRRFLSALVATLIAVVGFAIALKLGAKVTKAESDELLREDDVLLQAVAFSQSILFVFANLTLEEVSLKLSASSFIVVFAVAFYILRAWAKIKDSPKYRYYSMIICAFVLGNTVASILDLSFGILRKSIFDTTTIWGSVAFDFVIITEKVFKKRYGYGDNQKKN